MTVSTIQLGKVVDVSAGQPAPKPNDFSDDGFPFIRAGSLEGLLSGQTENDCQKIDAETAHRYRMRLYPKDTILFAKSGMSAKIGRVYRMRQPAYVVSHLAALAPIGKYEPSYLVHWLRAHPPSNLIKDEAYPSIRTSEVSSLEVPDIHIDEQRRIAATLDKADAIRRKRERAISLVDEFFKSVFLEIFGDPILNTKQWPVAPLSSFEEFLTSGSRGWAQYYSDKGAKFLRIGNVGSNDLLSTDVICVNAPDSAEAKRTKVRAGDLLISITADLGRTAVIPEEFGDAHINQHLALVRLHGISPLFVSAFLASPAGQEQFRRLDRVGVKSGLNFEDIRSLRIPIPPKPLQEKYERLWLKMKYYKKKMIKATECDGELFASLSQRAFRGEL